MFQHAYQSGTAVELVSSQDKNPLWKISGKTNKIFDKSVKGYVLSLDTASQKLSLPSNERQSLALVQPYFVFQGFISHSQPFSIELGIIDTSSQKRRLIFSSAAKEFALTPLHARIPNSSFIRNSWVNLSIDLVSFVNYCFPGNTFRSLENILINSFCKIRRVYTMRAPLWETDLETGDINTQGEQIPKNIDYQAGVQFVNQLITPYKLVGTHIEPQEKKPIKKQPANTAIAFGRKISPGSTGQHMQRVPRTASPRSLAHLSTCNSSFQQKVNTSVHTSKTNSPVDKSNGAIFRNTGTRLGTAASRYDESKEEEKIIEEDEEEEKVNRLSIHARDSLDNPLDQDTPEDSLSASMQNPLDNSFNQPKYQPDTQPKYQIDMQPPKDSLEESTFHTVLTKFNLRNQGHELSSDDIDEEYDMPPTSRTPRAHEYFSDLTQPTAKNQYNTSYYSEQISQATQFRPYTPPFTGLTSSKSLKKPAETAEEAEEGEAIELVYDPVLGCYYDPNTHEYYELNE